jgi:hypothetical protein
MKPLSSRAYHERGKAAATSAYSDVRAPSTI